MSLRASDLFLVISICGVTEYHLPQHRRVSRSSFTNLTDMGRLTAFPPAESPPDSSKYGVVQHLSVERTEHPVPLRFSPDRLALGSGLENSNPGATLAGRLDWRLNPRDRQEAPLYQKRWTQRVDWGLGLRYFSTVIRSLFKGEEVTLSNGQTMFLS